MSKFLISFAVICLVFVVFATAQKVELTVDASKSGAKIDRHIFGQFAEHLGYGVYEGVWVGKDSKIPNTSARLHQLLSTTNQCRHRD